MLNKIGELLKENTILADKITEKLKKLNQIDLWIPKTFFEKFLFKFTDAYDNILVNSDKKYTTMYSIITDMHEREHNSIELYNLLFNHLLTEETILIDNQNTREIILSQSNQIIELITNIKDLEEKLKMYKNDDKKESKNEV